MQIREGQGFFTDPRIANALEIFSSRNEKLQKEVANLSWHPGGLYDKELRAKHAQTAYLSAVEEQGINPDDVDDCDGYGDSPVRLAGIPGIKGVSEPHWAEARFRMAPITFSGQFDVEPAHRQR